MDFVIKINNNYYVCVINYTWHSILNGCIKYIFYASIYYIAKQKSADAKDEQIDVNIAFRYIS